MMHLNLRPGANGALNVLCLGAHSDDIEIGCGGAILELGERYPGTTFHWVVFSATGEREAEAKRAAELFAGAGLRGPFFKGFRDGFMLYSGSEIKTAFEELKPVNPDVIFTHCRDDAHQDHRLLSDLTWNTFRDHLILEYEIPKYDGDMGQPNMFMPLKPETCKAKVRHIMDVFPSQQGKRWFEESTFLSVMRLRGMECNSESGYAEGFYCRKVVL
ncbi:MAG TPA: PIG-L deacetylase family protein [Candidatus Sulfotelmatobacter sp.]|jgi:LmbE family N-acetylglucosaminyl deacetylase